LPPARQQPQGIPAIDFAQILRRETEKIAARCLAPLQLRIDSEVISPTAMAGGNTGLVLCQVGGQYSGK
jgi:hypothetical protein